MICLGPSFIIKPDLNFVLANSKGSPHPLCNTASHFFFIKISDFFLSHTGMHIDIRAECSVVLKQGYAHYQP